MKYIFLVFILLVVSESDLKSQTYSVNVTNGYGDGNYYSGDTVHIWSEIAANEIFDAWTGYTVDDAKEWHTYFIMPSMNVTVTSNTRIVPAITPNYEQIMGRDTLKNVYTYFPSNYKAVVYFFHGSNGSAWGWTYFCENTQLLKYIAADTFAIIITEAEEVTYNSDFNGDGAQRWSLDTLDADYDNIRIITDTLVNRGVMNAGDRKIALGMSNGGTFAFSLATQLNFDGIVAFCSQGLPQVLSSLTIPSMWCMARYDGHPSVGPIANANALAYSDTLQMNGICSDYRLNKNQPLYPERFARINGISLTQSQSIFTELDLNGWLTASNYFTTTPDSIVYHMQVVNPGAYPVFYSLSSIQQTDVINSIDATYSDHQMYNDVDNKVIQFLNDPCANSSVGESEPYENQTQKIVIYPNPANSVISFQVSDIESVIVYNSLGEQVRSTNNNSIDVTDLPNGMYTLKIITASSSYAESFIKQ